MSEQDALAFNLNGQDITTYLKHKRCLKFFESNYCLMKERFKKYQEMNYRGNSSTDVITYFDILIVQLRSMCLERNNERQCTVQRALKIVNRKDLADIIDNILNEPFSPNKIMNEKGEALSIKEAIKIISDKYICHYDDSAYFKDHQERIIEEILRNPENDYSLDNIVNAIIKCVNVGFNMKDESNPNKVKIKCQPLISDNN